MAGQEKGNGSVYYSRGEQRWIAEITLPDGSRKKKRSKTRKEADNWRYEQIKALSEGRTLPDDKITFDEFADKFLSDVAIHTMKPKTYQSYDSYLRLHIRPAFGRKKLNSITPAQIQRLYSQKLNEGLSAKTVSHIHGYLRRVLNEAVKWELIYRNPCQSVTPPKVQRKIPKVWTIDQAQTFLGAVRDHQYFGIYLIALTTGSRRGEILGMEWENIDWNKSTISIKKTVVELKGVATISTPKTAKSARKIVLPQVVIDHLKTYPDKQGFIFQSKANTPVHPRNLLRHFYSVLDSVDVPRIRFHDLRHTAATILLQRDVHPKKVQELLGHSSITLTLDTYSHVIPGIDDQTANEMDAVFK